MRSVILSTLLLVLAVCTVSAQNRNTSICRLGFTYDISQSKNWGNNKPVIKSVIPYSSAEQAGIKKYDVIEEINGVPVTEISVDEIPQLLNPAGRNDVLLTISNLSSPSKQVLVKKDCKKSNAITEDQLASAYAMYSLETTNEQEFVCPFKTTVTSDGVDFGNFKTFAFSTIDENNRKLETVINECIENELTKKGLTVDIAKPDLLIQTFYFFDKNPNYIDGHYAGLIEWDSSVKKMQKALDENQELVIGEYPADYGTPATVYKVSMGFAISPNSQHQAEAAKLLNYMLNGDGVKTLALERGIPASKAAQETLKSEGMLEGLVYDANQLATANAPFKLSPYYEDSALKDDAEGAYQEIMNNMSYDDEDSKDLAQEMIDAVDEVEASKA